MNEPQQPMLRLFQYLRSYYLKFSYAISYSVLNKIADLAPPLLIGWLVDIVSQQTPTWISWTTGSNDIWTNAIFIAVLIIIIFAIESFFEWAYQYQFMTLAQRVQHDLRMDAYQQLQSREIAYFENNRTGNLMAMLNDDINQLERFLNNSFNEIIQLTTLFIFGGVVLFASSWQLALIGLLPIPLIFWGSFYYQRKIAPHYQHIRQAVGDLGSRLENNISGILVVKSFTAENYETERVRVASDNYQQANFKAIRLSSLYVPLIRIFIAVGFASTMLIGSYWIIYNPGKFTIGQLTFFAMMIQRLLWPVTRLGRVFDEYERARASARRVFGLMDTPNQISNVEQPQSLQNLKGHLHFDKVFFAYQDEHMILKGIDFEAKAGEIIGIAGVTGAGKTTLVKLLLRLYDVTEGSIKIDGIDIRQVNLKTLRRKIALVSQDVYLFHGTIYENIAYGMDEATLEQVMAAAQQAQLHDFVASLPKGYDSIVGERGIKLSGGQRQRLSIARAILKNAPILILDEATSSVDTETERAIQQNLYQLTEGRTALIIAHRLSTIRHANKILVLKAGQIIEEGTHDSLLKQDGIYADLWKVQIGEVAAN